MSGDLGRPAAEARGRRDRTPEVAWRSFTATGRSCLPIHRLQRQKQTLEGLLARRDKDATLKVHQNAQRLLRPLLVANPFAHALTFLDDRTRTRRDFPKYLTLIRTIALLHQHQRPVRTVEHGGAALEYVEVTLADIEVANRLAAAVLGRSLDEQPPQTWKGSSQNAA